MEVLLPEAFAQVFGKDDAETLPGVRAGEAPGGAGRTTDSTVTPVGSVTGS